MHLLLLASYVEMQEEEMVVGNVVEVQDSRYILKASCMAYLILQISF